MIVSVWKIRYKIKQAICIIIAALRHQLPHSLAHLTFNSIFQLQNKNQYCKKGLHKYHLSFISRPTDMSGVCSKNTFVHLLIRVIFLSCLFAAALKKLKRTVLHLFIIFKILKDIQSIMGAKGTIHSSKLKFDFFFLLQIVSYGQIRDSRYTLWTAAPLKPVLYFYFLFIILLGLCEFTQPNRGEEKLQTARTFFWGGGAT